MLKKQKNCGFTLAEVIVVLVILAILAALMIPSMTGWIDKAREKEVDLELRTVALAAQSACTELYADYKITNSTQILYVKGVPSADAIDKDFEKLLRDYLGTDIDFDNLTGVAVVGDTMTIYYAKDGADYTYTKTGADVTIEKS